MSAKYIILYVAFGISFRSFSFGVANTAITVLTQFIDILYALHKYF